MTDDKRYDTEEHNSKGVPDKKYTNVEWKTQVTRQLDFWNSMNQMMEVHLQEAAEFILEQGDQSLVVDAIGDTVMKIDVLQNLFAHFQNQETLWEKNTDHVETLDNIHALGAGTSSNVCKEVEAAYRDMLGRSEHNKENQS